MNRIVIMGRLTADPELKTTNSGLEVASFQVAINRPVGKDKEKVADFLPCTAWRQTAAFICNYFHKGDMIALEGSLQSRKYEDKEGKNRTAYDIQVQRVEFCGGKSNKSNNADTSDTRPSGPSVTVDEIVDISDNDLPF